MEKDLTSLNRIDARRFENRIVFVSRTSNWPLTSTTRRLCHATNWKKRHVETNYADFQTARRYAELIQSSLWMSLTIRAWWRWRMSDSEIVWGERQIRASDLEDEGRTGFSTSEEERPNSADTTLELDTNLYRSFDFRRVTNDNRTSSESHGFASFVIDVVSDSRYVATIRIWTELKLINISVLFRNKWKESGLEPRI